MSGLEKALLSFSQAGCPAMYVDGSFVTSKERPSDYDACWETSNVLLSALDPILLEFGNARAAQKAKYFGEFFPADVSSGCPPGYATYFHFFQIDKATGNPKGIIGLRLKGSND